MQKMVFDSDLDWVDFAYRQVRIVDSADFNHILFASLLALGYDGASQIYPFSGMEDFL